MAAPVFIFFKNMILATIKGKMLVINILTTAFSNNKRVKLFSKNFSVREMVEEGLLESYAREELNEVQMHEIEMRLDFDLELGEELEQIYTALEKSGWEPSKAR